MHTRAKPAAIYLLRPLQEILQIDIPQAVKLSYPLPPDRQHEFIRQVDREVEQIKEFLPVVDYILQGRALKDYIRCHQYDTIELIASLNHHTRPLGADPEAGHHVGPDSLTQALRRSLEGFLQMLEQTYPKQYNGRVRLPAGYRHLVRYELLGHLQELDPAVVALGIDKTLWHVATTPVRLLVHSPSLPELDYRMLSYLRRLLRAIRSLSGATPSNPTKEFHRLLHRHNFNSSDYIHYCVAEMERQLSAPGLPYDARLEKIFTFQKTVRQFRPVVKQALDADAVSLSKFLTAWLDAEVAALQQVNILPRADIRPPQSLPATDQVASTGEDSDDADEAKPDGVKLNMTVPQAAFGMKILKKIAVIDEKNMTKVGERFARSIKTIGTDRPSPKSLMNNYGLREQDPATYAYALSTGQKIITYVLKNMPAEEISKNLFEEEFIQTVSKHIAPRSR